MAAQWDEEEKLEEILERRKMEGSSLKVEVLQKVPELVVHERMSQGKGVKGRNEKKNVLGWSMEEMKEKTNVALVEDTEEMRKWSVFSQSEMDLCWKNVEEEVWTSIRQKKAKERHAEVELPRMEEGAQKQEIQNKKVERRLLGKNFLFVQRVQLAAPAKQAGEVNGRRRDEAAATNGDYERSNKENQIKRKNGR